MTSPVGSSVPGDTETAATGGIVSGPAAIGEDGCSFVVPAEQEQLERPNFEGHGNRECGEHRSVGPHRAWCYDCAEWCYPRPEMACKGCMVPTLLVEVERLTQELDRANTAHARALVRYSQDPLLQRIIDTEAERDAAEDVLRWLVSLDAPGSAARASVTLPDIIARAKVVLRVTAQDIPRRMAAAGADVRLGRRSDGMSVEPNTEQSAAVYVSEGFCPLTGKPIDPEAVR